MLASSRKTLRCRKAPAAGEIARPTKPPRAGGDTQTPAIRQARRRADASIGPYAGGGGRPARETAQRRDTACRPRSRRPFALHCRAGVHARRGGLRRPGRILARSCAAPLCWLTPTAPLTGEPSGRQSPQSLPCKGRCLRRKAQTEGCIAALRPKYPTRPGRALPCPRRGRCSHRPGNPAVAQGPQAAGDFARPTLRPRAGSNAQTPAIRQARRGGWCQPRRILARQGAAPLRRLGRHYRFAVPALRCVC